MVGQRFKCLYFPNFKTIYAYPLLLDLNDWVDFNRITGTQAIADLIFIGFALGILLFVVFYFCFYFFLPIVGFWIF